MGLCCSNLSRNSIYFAKSGMYLTRLRLVHVPKSSLWVLVPDVANEVESNEKKCRNLRLVCEQKYK